MILFFPPSVIPPNFFCVFVFLPEWATITCSFPYNAAIWNEVVKKDIVLSEISLPHEVCEMQNWYF